MVTPVAEEQHVVLAFSACDPSSTASGRLMVSSGTLCQPICRSNSCKGTNLFYDCHQLQHNTNMFVMDIVQVAVQHAIIRVTVDVGFCRLAIPQSPSSANSKESCRSIRLHGPDVMVQALFKAGLACQALEVRPGRVLNHYHGSVSKMPKSWVELASVELPN